MLLGKDLSSRGQYEGTRQTHQELRNQIKSGLKKLSVEAYIRLRQLHRRTVISKLNSIRSFGK